MRACIVLLSSILGHQGPGPATGSSGREAIEVRVVDAGGKAVGGARIRIEPLFDAEETWNLDNPRECVLEGPEVFHEASLHQLRWTELPHAVSDGEGLARIPLTRDQRRLGVVAGRRLEMVVEKEGFVTWHVPLGTCLARVGSIEARLQRCDARAMIRGKVILPAGVEGPARGIVDVTYGATCQRVASSIELSSTSTWIDAVPNRVAVEVRGDGTFDFPRDPEGGPSSAFPGVRLEGVGYEVSADIVGCEGGPVFVPPDRQEVEVALRAGCNWSEFADQVAAPPGVDSPQEMTVVYQLVGDWIRGRIPRGCDSVWRLKLRFGPIPPLCCRWLPVAVEAEGLCGVILEHGGCFPIYQVLEPAPREPVAFKVRSKEGVALPGALVEIDDGWFVQTRRGLSRAVRRHRPVFRGVTGADGGVAIPAEYFRRASVVSVQATGHAPWNGETNECASVREAVLEPVANGRVHVSVKDAEGRPVSGASLLFGSDAYRWGAFTGPPPVTDDLGGFETVLPPGRHRCLAFHEGFAFGIEAFEVAAGTESRLTIALAPAATGCVQVVDQEGRPLPWQAVARRLDDRLGAPGNSPWSFTDSAGRARLDGVPATDDRATVFVRGLSPVPLPERTFSIDQRKPVNRIELTTTRTVPILIRLPERLGNAMLDLRTEADRHGFPLSSPGDVRLFVPEGAATLSLRDYSLPRVTQQIDVKRGARTVVDWRMQHWPEVVIHLGADDGEVIPHGVRVVEVSEHPPAPFRGPNESADLAAMWRRPGDGSSTLRFRAPPSGKLIVELQHDRMVPQRIELLEGQPADHEVRVERR